MLRRPPRSTRTDTLFPYTTLFRSIDDIVNRYLDRHTHKNGFSPPRLDPTGVSRSVSHIQPWLLSLSLPTPRGPDFRPPLYRRERRYRPAKRSPNTRPDAHQPGREDHGYPTPSCSHHTAASPQVLTTVCKHIPTQRDVC